MSSNNQYCINWRKVTKQRLIDYKGGKCVKCGYNKSCPRAYHFHHRNPLEKEFDVSNRGRNKSFDKLKTEIDKCDLLCANCHAEVHDEPYAEHRTQLFNRIAKLEELKKELELNRQKQCPVCGSEFYTKYKHQKHCSEDCGHKAQRKLVWPSREDLLTDLKSMSMCAIGRKYGASDNAVRNWCKYYNISRLSSIG